MRSHAWGNPGNSREANTHTANASAHKGAPASSQRGSALTRTQKEIKPKSSCYQDVSKLVRSTLGLAGFHLHVYKELDDVQPDIFSCCVAKMNTSE